jgi:putative methyltransferase (TIGR04325 family)
MLRKAAAELLPPIVHRPLLNLWHSMRGIGAYTYEGAYQSLEAVPVTNHIHHDQQVGEGVAQVALRRLNAQPSSASSEDDGRWILPMLVSYFAGQRLTILDFGGGTLTGWDRIVGHLPNFEYSRLKYVLVETEAVARALQKAIIHPQFVIEDRVPVTLDAPLIVCASGVLQYISDYPDTLRRFAKLKPEYIIISLTPISDLPTYARMQCNNPHSRYGSLVLNRAEIVGILEDASYSLSFVMDHNYQTTHKNAPGPSRYTSMVFRKKVLSS